MVKKPPYEELEKRLEQLETQAADSQKQSEEALHDSEELFREIGNSVQDAIVIVSTDELISFWNPAAQRIFGFKPAEVIGKPMHSILMPGKYHKAFTEGFEQFRKTGHGNLIGKTVELSALNNEGIEFPIELSLSAARIKGSWAAIGTIRDISGRKESEKTQKDHMALLRKTLGGIIQAMALAVETRDPYTAGHQRQVANLARMIAQEMHLPGMQVEGIRTAGVIHDIGKLNVPFEILVKPVKLSEYEFGIIRTHSEMGYNILKGISFDMPIPEIVYQHHERMDGSGYPQHIKGDDILTEARVLAVADVMDAMASHRPYRSSLSMDEATSGSKHA
jgi:PAS domain S-box-containing protein/putative nucleotidyltransferase with HDIG domain